MVKASGKQGFYLVQVAPPPTVCRIRTMTFARLWIYCFLGRSLVMAGSAVPIDQGGLGL